MCKIKISKKELDKFRKLGIVDEIALRNLFFKKEIEKRSAQEGKTVGDVIEEVAEENCLAPDTVRAIFYYKESRKKDYTAPIQDITVIVE